MKTRAARWLPCRRFIPDRRMRLPHRRSRRAASRERQDHRHPRVQERDATYRIEQMLTASVVREFTTRTHYRILNDTGADADATLRGTVLSTTASPLTYDTSTGQAASILVVVSMKVTLTDRNGKVLYQNPAYLFREQYEVSQDLTSFFEEDSPAFRRLSQDFARTLVSNILEGF